MIAPPIPGAPSCRSPVRRRPFPLFSTHPECVRNNTLPAAIQPVFDIFRKILPPLEQGPAFKAHMEIRRDDPAVVQASDHPAPPGTLERTVTRSSSTLFADFVGRHRPSVQFCQQVNFQRRVEPCDPRFEKCRYATDVKQFVHGCYGTVMESGNQSKDSGNEAPSYGFTFGTIRNKMRRQPPTTDIRHDRS